MLEPTRHTLGKWTNNADRGRILFQQHDGFFMLRRAL
jgi:hypothetical protein